MLWLVFSGVIFFFCRMCRRWVCSVSGILLILLRNSILLLVLWILLIQLFLLVLVNVFGWQLKSLDLISDFGMVVQLMVINLLLCQWLCWCNVWLIYFLLLLVFFLMYRVMLVLSSCSSFLFLCGLVKGRCMVGGVFIVIWWWVGFCR